MIILTEELRKICEWVELNKSSELRNQVITTCDKIVELSNLARQEGLLALEEATFELNTDDIIDKTLKFFIMLVVDGTDTDLVQEIGTARYYSSCYTGYDALIYMLIFNGSLQLQAGGNPYNMHLVLLNMLPLYIRDEFESRINKAGGYYEYISKIWDKPTKDYREDICSQKFAFPSNSYMHYEIDLVNYMFKTFSDKSIQKILMNVDTHDLRYVMKVLSGESNTRILDNMSTRLAQMIAKDVATLGRVRLSSVRNSASMVLSVVTDLLSRWVIQEECREQLVAFSNIVPNSEVHTGISKDDTVVKDVVKILEDYKRELEDTLI